MSLLTCACGKLFAVGEEVQGWTQLPANTLKLLHRGDRVSEVVTKCFSSAGFSQSCWHNIFTIIYNFTKILQNLKVTHGGKWKDSGSLCLAVCTLQYIWAHINIPKINRKDREWLNFLGLFIVCWADMPGVIYLPTIKNIYESVSAVCSKQEVINLLVYPHSSPLPLSVELSPPRYLSPHLFFLSFLIFQ